MRPGYIAFSALSLVALGLSGCGLFKGEPREPWRTQAEEACMAQKLVQNTAYTSKISAIQGAGTCGMDYPFRVAAFAGGSVGLTSRATLACPIIPRTDGWLEEVVQPAASLYFGQAVVEVRAGSYNCRPRNNQRGAKLSEHSFGNALDVFAFRLADGREVTVKGGWRGRPDEQEFLREVFVGACSYYTTVLGPGADIFHYDHFHLDLARHSARGDRRVCKPALKFEPRLGEAAATSRGIPQRERGPAIDIAPLDVDEGESWDEAALARGAPRATPRPPPERPAYAGASPTGASQAGASQASAAQAGMRPGAPQHPFDRPAPRPAPDWAPPPVRTAGPADRARMPSAAGLPPPGGKSDRLPPTAQAYRAPEPLVLQPKTWLGEPIY